MTANDDLDADAKRKLQNRAAQRAFRERKERHVIDLEEKVVQQDADLAQCRELIEQYVLRVDQAFQYLILFSCEVVQIEKGERSFEKRRKSSIFNHCRQSLLSI